MRTPGSRCQRRADPGALQVVSEQSLHIYARLNESTYTYWVKKAMSSHVDSTRTTNLVEQLPQLDDDRLVSQLVRLNLVEAAE